MLCDLAGSFENEHREIETLDLLQKENGLSVLERPFFTLYMVDRNNRVVNLKTASRFASIRL